MIGNTVEAKAPTPALQATTGRQRVRKSEMNKNVVGISLGAAGLGLLAWVLYDPSEIVAAFGLRAVVSEAVVVLVALTIVAASLTGGATLLSRSRTTE
jgi:hypothetical protein